MRNELMQDLVRDQGLSPKKLKIAIDTGKALTKSLYKDATGREICDKFPSAIGIVSGNVSFNKEKPFRCSLLPGEYYIDAPRLCNITTTNDNEKNGAGQSISADNHDREIVTLGACLSIVKAMKALDTQYAIVDVAIGMPITEYLSNKDKGQYFQSILPVGKPVRCSYGGNTYIFTVNRFKVCPETLSAFVANSGNEKGNLILVDIGGNNIQFICSNGGNIDFDPTKTFTDKGGVNSFVRKLAVLMKQKQIEPVGAFNEIMGWLEKPKTIPASFGDAWKDRFTDLGKSQKAAYYATINKAFDPIHGIYSDEISRGYKIYYTGGGSLLLKDEIKADPAAQVFDGGEYANVKGFYKLLR